MPSPHFTGLGKQILNLHKDSQKAVFKPREGDPQPIEVIFNDRYQDTDRDGIPFGDLRPVAWFLTGAICPQYKDHIEINGKEYVVREIKPDGLELTELSLAEIME